jgi:hypothetical protein
MIHESIRNLLAISTLNDKETAKQLREMHVLPVGLLETKRSPHEGE